MSRIAAPEQPPRPAPAVAWNQAAAEPLRADLYGPEHLEEHARRLAEACRATTRAAGDPLLRRFLKNGEELVQVHRHIVEVVGRRETISPDAEWLLDNFHIIEETLREVRQDLPRGYYEQLPKLADGPCAGLPRVYLLAVELIAHTDSCLDENNITRFVQAWQPVAPLTIGELWAVPIMLRLGLIENLRCLARQMLHTWEARRKGDAWVARLVGPAAVLPEPHAVHDHSDWSDPCFVCLFQSLRDRGPDAALAVEWLERVLTHRGTNPAEVLRREHQRQAANQVSVGNCVTSLRLLSNLDWSVFFERTSVVEEALRQDPAGVYARQDFATKDRYRRTVEQLARGSRIDEVEVARRALELARQAPGAPGAGGRDHVGYYLVGPGRQTLEADIDYRPRPGDRLLRAILAHPDAVYFSALTLFTLLILAGVLAGAAQPGTGPLLLALAGLAALLPASDLAVGLVHYLLTLALPPRVLPKLDFKDGIPADWPTFVVMPTLLVRPESGPSLAERLEVHYLSNPDPQLRFALLTDFADAPTEQRPEDDEYLRNALASIRALNERHAAGGPDRFFLFHRKRVWDPAQGCWMGWERKRGKLCEFNRLLRGATDTTYTVQSGDLSGLPRVRFVITLDADTQLPRETAGRLAATLAHPLNRPCFDPAQGRVVSGYGVLQPRVSLSLVAATRSLFARILASSAGIDPYTTAVSDVYQDLFGRGTFTGKGIYDVDAFEAAVGRTFPDNRILSHDLIEGNYARCGLVTDIELLDDFPARYHAYARREHRWVRGDWQILPWVLPRVPTPASGGRQPPVGVQEQRVDAPRSPGVVWRSNPLPALERWKVFDNLRRSLVPPALIVLLGLGWTVLPGSPLLWTILALAVLALPLFLLLVRTGVDLFRGSWVMRLREARGAVAATTGQALLSATFLAEQARQMVDAVGRTLVRLTITHRNLLEWETAASTERRLGTGFAHFCATLWGGPLVAVALGTLVALVRPDVLPEAGPFLAAWLLSPAVAFLVSRPRAPAEPPLSEPERRDVRRLARKTWHFFETFVGPDDHWLPPDNFQENPKGQVAHRTSPTNVGLYLLSNLAAHDLGYLDLPTLADRLEKTFETLEQLERHRGHFYNWYDTHTLTVLSPPYVSTVDSGNLVGCLLTLRQGLLARARAPRNPARVQAGLRDTAAQVQEILRDLEPSRESAGAFAKVQSAADALARLLEEFPADVSVPPQPSAGRASEGLAGWLERLEGEAGQLSQALAALTAEVGEEPEELARWVAAFGREVRGRRAELEAAGSAALAARLEGLADRAGALAAGMDFKFLYNAQRHLFAIGFNRAHGKLDNAHYDLLASESCLTSFLAIARGDVPRRHWFQLGRPLTRAGGGIALLSWGGTMFEYLMPRLLLPYVRGTLLDESARAAVDRHIEYGRQCRVPWGISESGFAALDAALDYQYQSFGVPGLGLKRGLSRDLVIAPYATALALMVRPHAALANLHALRAERAEGPFGMYEAVDYTRDRLRARRRSAVVRSYMAHHQGMSLLAMTNCLLGDALPRLLHAEPMVRATDLLLQERVPWTAPLVDAHGDEALPPPVVREGVLPMSRRLTTPDTPHPRTHLLSGGRTTVMLTNAGAGFSASAGLDVTRWREDRTTDAWGQFCYIRDLQSGLTWSAGHQPVCRPAEEYEVVFSTDKAEFRRRDDGIETHLEVTVSPENAAEVRRLTLTNRDSRTRDLDVTSYVEVVLAAHGADLAHPAFGKLFLETEWLPAPGALLCRRRPRAADQKPVWCVHALSVDGPTVGPVEHETDRARFLGRGRTPARPAALDLGAELSGTTGAVLDPILSLRRRLRLPPGASASVAFTTAVAFNREAALALADQYHDVHGVQRAFELAWAHTQVQLRHLHLSAEEAHLYQRLAAHLVYAGSALRAPASVLAANRQGREGLWRHGISGDRPILLVLVAEAEDVALVRKVLLAHAWWRLQGLEVDLVLLNEHASGYQEDVQQELQSLVRTSDSHDLVDKPGGVFLRKADHFSPEDRVLLLTAARVVLSGTRGSLVAQLEQQEKRTPLPDRLANAGRRTLERSGEPSQTKEVPLGKRHLPEGLQFGNGLGGFTADGREYVVSAAPGVLPPAPWTNVVANPRFGFLATESGGGCTWAGNSQQNRLTPWTNDPVSDPPGEVVYLRDEATGEVWTPTPLPMGSAGCLVRHGPGYTAFEQTAGGLRTELVLFVPAEDPVKVLRLRVQNTGKHARTLSATFYAEWVLGTVRDQAAMQVVTERDADTGALLARNPFNTDFAAGIAFAHAATGNFTCTADRTEFLGRNGGVDRPAALERVGLAGQVGAGLDPCAALMTPFTLPAGGEREVVFLLGEGQGIEEVRALVRKYADPAAVQAAFDEVRRRWEEMLGAVQVRTPDAGMDLLLNRWLLYQVVSCRLWGRSAFYQSGGAYGFRDQLQDVMALVYAAPAEARAHLLRAASRQFLEGDVQHWWHPPAGRGVRTRFSDDFLWLPFVALHYVTTTGDRAFLDEPVSFLRAPSLQPEQEEEYGQPEVTEEKAALYEHCARALDHGLRFGAHGLPLMGTGDWNDGMNRVGAGGKGESVWNAWFLLSMLPRFADIAEKRGDAGRAARWREAAESLKKAVEEQAWDGGWYRRAYFDDGTPLGSASNDECRIDSLPQSWAVTSGAGDPARAREAMAAVERLLVRPEGLILLFAPPFDQGPLQPGYIKGYVPGIRENGGQYTHAATWVVQATAMLGQGTRAVQLFDLLGPISHTASAETLARYKVEPYVVAADVYGVGSHVGRGGWTWYTGSAAWLYRVGLESILGFHLEGDRLRLNPCIPAAWPGFEITYRHGSATYQILVENPAKVERGVKRVSVDGTEQGDGVVPLVDRGTHEVRVVLG